MAKAELSAMEQLHAMAAKVMLGELQSGEISPSMMSTVVRFLKDNHIETTGGASDHSEMEKALEDMNNLPYDGEVRPN